MRPLLKYCGNHSFEDLRHVSESRADFIGVVFASSRRQVTSEQLAIWLKDVQFRPTQKLVGLFVNPTLEEVEQTVRNVPLDIIQCHGTESPEFVNSVIERTNLPVWKVIHHDGEAVTKMSSYASTVSAFVIDSKVKGAWGGTGQKFDWSHIPIYMEEGKRLGVPVFIAGGINNNNITSLLEYQPDGIDISSGIEREGRKSIEEIRQIEERVKEK